MIDAAGMALAEVIMCRARGAVAGAFLGLVMVYPSSWHGFVQRMATSLISAFVFAPTVRWYLDWPATPDNITAAACLVALFFWWAAHTVIRAFNSEWLARLIASRTRD